VNVETYLRLPVHFRLVENSGHGINGSPSASDIWTVLQTFFIGVLQVRIYKTMIFFIAGSGNKATPRARNFCLMFVFAGFITK
jgi:hypothetical protein